MVPEGAEAVSRPSPDYPILPTIPLSAFSDPKKTKTSHVSKVGNTAYKKYHLTRAAQVSLHNSIDHSSFNDFFFLQNTEVDL